MSGNNTATPPTEPASSPAAPPPSSNQPQPTPTPTPTPPPASSPPPASQPQSSASPPPPASSASPPPKSSAPPPASTLVVTAPTPTPSLDIRTSIIVISSGGAPAGTIVVTVGPSGGQTTGSAHPTSTNPALQNADKNSTSGLSSGGKTAIAVVIPVVVVALLVLGALFFWRRRKQRKNNEDERRKEVEEYGYNPNHDPTLPTMAEDESGYRGWGNTQTSSNRKASTTLTSGMTHSDSNSNPGGYAPVSPLQGTFSDANSNDMLMRDRYDAHDADGIGALGAVGGAAPNSTQNATGIRRGPSNASSSYSMGDHSEHSAEFHNMPSTNPEYYPEHNNHGYYQSGPYGNQDSYAGGAEPVIRDVSARRNTRIEKPSIFPQQGNSGIAQNF